MQHMSNKFRPITQTTTLTYSTSQPVFLLGYSFVEESIYNSSVPKFLTTYKFMSLLNLSNKLDIYSSLRYLWEGKEEDDGYLSVKSELNI
jgi:hypothetical protein